MFRANTSGTQLAISLGMVALFECVLVLSSIALSIVLSRLAVGEMFRLVRITPLNRPPAGDASSR